MRETRNFASGFARRTLVGSDRVQRLIDRYWPDTIRKSAVPTRRFERKPQGE
jgi:hypothetical protein